MRRFQLSTAAFAIVMVTIGLWGLAQSGFVAIWAPGISVPGLRAPMAAVCSLVSTFAGFALLWRRSAHLGASILLVLLCIWIVWCKGLALVHAPTELVSWESLGETAVIAAAAWSLSSGFGSNGKNDRLAGLVARSGPRTVYGLSLIAFGLAHFDYPDLTASLVPAWLPLHLAWVYLTGATYIGAGVVLLAGRATWLAAALSALQMALFTALVWLPKIAAGARDFGTLNETAISIALATSGWVIVTALRPQAQR